MLAQSYLMVNLRAALFLDYRTKQQLSESLCSAEVYLCPTSRYSLYPKISVKKKKNNPISEFNCFAGAGVDD